MSADNKWIPLPRNYEEERKALSAPREKTTQHPLFVKKATPIVTSTSSSAVGAADGAAGSAASAASPKKSAAPAMEDDPLRALLAGGAGNKGSNAAAAAEDDDDLDPLTAFAKSAPKQDAAAVAAASPTSASASAAAAAAASAGGSVVTAQERGEFEFWADKCGRILAKYTTSASIAVNDDFLNEDADDAIAKVPKSVDQASSRLEELDATHGGGRSSYLTQKEYIAHFEDLHKKLKSAWEAGERVIALRIAIQCAKVLGDVRVPAFYPSMFVLLTRVLHTFGDLVFERIKSVGVETVHPATRQVVVSALPNTFKSSDVCASAKETCRNWFFKTACIRELLPRLYIDLALMKCYRFLEDDSFVDNFSRLSKQIRGIGNPLIATYARAFLTSRALSMSYTFVEQAPPPQFQTVIAPVYRRAVLEAFDDCLFVLKATRGENDFASVPLVADGTLSGGDYLDLYSPAVEWLVQNVAFNASDELFFAMLQQFKDSCPTSMLLLHIISFFSPQQISNNALTINGLIKQVAETTHGNRAHLYLALAKKLVRHPPPQAQRLAILNDVWKTVSKVADVAEYLRIAAVFVEFLLACFGPREVNIFLKDVIKHARRDDAYRSLQRELEEIAVKVTSDGADVRRTLAMDTFLPLLDLLDRQNKVSVGKLVLEAWIQLGGTTADPVIIHTLFDTARALHDSVTAMSSEEETRAVARLVVGFVRTVDFDRDLEQQLNTFVDFRAAFTSLDAVTVELVERVALLASRAHAFTKGKHTKKTSAFVKAALAYCHITIPSLDDKFECFRLFTACAEVALVNQMVVQSEGFVKAALALIPALPPHYTSGGVRRSTDALVQSSVLHLASFLLYFPGHPTHGPFYLVHGLLNALQKYEPWEGPRPLKVQCYLGFLRLFATYAQVRFPVKIDRVESNDTLYGGDAEYLAGAAQFTAKLIELVQEDVEKIGSADIASRRQQSTLALDFINTLTASFVMNKELATLVYRLFATAKKAADGCDARYADATYDALLTRKGRMYRELAKKLRESGGGFEHKPALAAPGETA